MEKKSNQSSNKKVDEAWKEAAEKEKRKEEKKKVTRETISNQRQSVPEVTDFTTFLSSLSMQALIFLGAVPNPLTDKIEPNLEQAKYMIDTIDMLREKTKGNLTDKEADLIENILYELQIRYVEKSK